MGKPNNLKYPVDVDKEYELINSFVREFVRSFDKIAGKEFNSLRFRKTLPFVRNAIHDLRTLFEDLNFEGGLNEIYFFKQIKPLIYSYLISEIELSRIFLYKSETVDQSDAAYYSSFIAEYQEFFAGHNFQYRYYKSLSTEFDNLLFARQEDISLVTIDYAVLSDPSFSTALDSIFAKFIAFERVQEILMSRMRFHSHIKTAAPEEIETTDRALIWTGEAINLVEVAYGIWLTGQINNGEATISEIIFWMEKKLKLKIGRAYRRWTEISRRKLISSTKYLDQMKETINQRIEEENGIKSSKRNSKESFQHQYNSKSRS
jgi:hypothetical protein